MAQYIAKRVKGAKKLEDHDYAAIVIDPISAVLHNPKAVRNNIPPEKALLQMIDMLISLTGSAVIAATNPGEYPELEAQADSRIILSPISGSPDMFSLRGEFRNFPPRSATDCTWRHPRFTV